MDSQLQKITIFSDYICPFCYIGNDRAEKLENEFNIDIEWKMIEIHPEIPVKGVNRDEVKSPYLDEVWRNVKLLSDEANLDIQIPDVLANSRLSFIATEFAREKGKYEEFHNAVMEAYWKQNLNIGELKVLEQLAKSIGLDFSGFKNFVANSDWEKKLQNNMEEARDNNVMAVPSFVFNDKVVAGAVPYEQLRDIVKKEMEA